MKHKELIWMVAPCVLLGVLAFAWRYRPGAILLINEPFAVVVEKVEKEPLKPREVADGYDTKLKITLNHRGKAPDWWGKMLDSTGSNEGIRLVYDDKGKQSVVKFPPPKLPSSFKRGDFTLWNPQWDAEKQRYIARALMPGALVPPKPGVVKVQARIPFELNNKPLCPPARLDHIVRKEGEVIQVPEVSHDTNLRIKKIWIDETPPTQAKADGYTADTRVQILLGQTLVDSKTNYMPSVELEAYDVQGRSYPSEHYTGQSSDSYHSSVQQTEKLALVDLNLKKIPRRNGALWLKGTIGIGDYWPLKINVPLRDASGRDLKKPPSSVPFVVDSILVQPADAQTQKESGADTSVKIAVKFTRVWGEVNYKDWQGDWSQHLVDEKGKQYWLFKTPYPVGPQPIGYGSGYAPTASSNNVHLNYIEYIVPLNQVPNSVKNVKFRAEIGMRGTKRLPVEVMLRKNGEQTF